MKSIMLETRMIEHCAPTLAGIKSASLFNYFFTEKEVVQEEVKEVNGLLNERGVYVETLLWRENSVLVYTYRKSHIQKELQQPKVMELLSKYGYQNCEVKDCIAHLKTRLQYYTCFPHEIGIFLGYPLEDVIGFIENRGENCKCCGLWKVYCNEKETIRLFHKIKKCNKVYLQVFAKGRSITQMTVSA